MEDWNDKICLQIWKARSSGFAYTTNDTLDTRRTEIVPSQVYDAKVYRQPVSQLVPEYCR